MRRMVSVMILVGVFFLCCGEGEKDDLSIPPPPVPYVDSNPEWHPIDMNKISYVRWDDTWVVDISTGESECVIEGGCGYDWSPDGRYMVGKAVEGRGIWLFDLETGERKRLTCPKGGCVHDHPRMSPCGTKIAYYSQETGENGIWVLDLTTMEQRRISTHTLADWSPDGKYILTESLEIISSEDGSLIRQIHCSACPSSIGGLVSAAWSPDGEKIAFGGDCYTGKGRNPYGPGIYTINIDGSDERLVFCGGAVPSWSPDGSMIAYGDTSRTGHRGTAIWVMNADGSNRRQVTLLE